MSDTFSVMTPDEVGIRPQLRLVSEKAPHRLPPPVGGGHVEVLMQKCVRVDALFAFRDMSRKNDESTSLTAHMNKNSYWLYAARTSCRSRSLVFTECAVLLVLSMCLAEARLHRQAGIPHTHLVVQLNGQSPLVLAVSHSSTLPQDSGRKCPYLGSNV